MSYIQVSTRDDDDHIQGPPLVPASPPPPFSSRPSSPTQSQALLSRHDPLADDAERTLAETFDSPSDDEDASDGEDDDAGARRRLVRPQQSESRPIPSSNPPIERRVTQYPAFAPTTTRLYGSGRANDGVFANLSAKPSQNDDVDEKPPVCSSFTYSVNVFRVHLTNNITYRHMNKPLQMQRHLTGKQPF
jgi:Protein of unknown function (DUF2370)